MTEAPLEVDIAPLFLTRLANASSHIPRMHDQLFLSSYVPPQEWVPSLTDTVAPGPEGAREIIDRWSPFNKLESSVTHMRNLYPTLL